ncbi:AAA family ATPase [Thalassomonas actiniarum]|uniref:PhoH family protein n=1 Tax=Thalassomonas actiniarum TaxID=485447 RepID=A0AAE9YTX1_9GAMM|nr:AAA family ATPase [Thalassomonas actiniarum]WDE00738.1 PhoH family protein [Thalassomonas actiniarum]
MRLPRRAELTEQQEDFLMEAPFDKPVLCVGPPGTGKTVLALYRAAILRQKEEKVDLIMHSKLLNRYVERSVKELAIDINTKTWNSWVYGLWRKGHRRLNMPQLEKYLPDFKKMVSLIIEGKVNNLPNMYWNHLIIDEGQDFPKEFYLFLTFLKSQSNVVNGRKAPAVTIFADDNQRMEEKRNSTIRDIQNYMPGIEMYEVTANYRNTRPIAKLASYFHIGMSTGVPEVPKSIKGLIPQLRSFDTLEKEVRSIVNWLHNNDDLSAGVIVPDIATLKRVDVAITPIAEEKNFTVQKYMSGTEAKTINFHKGGTITIVCDKSCKGLEFDGVFIPQIQSYKTDGVNEDFFKMKMYVMISRARKYLQLSYSDCDEAPKILKILPTPEQGVLKWKI